MESAWTPTDPWLATPLGARVLRDEAALASQVLDDVFGFELLQVGSWGENRPLLRAARTQHTTVVAPRVETGVTLCAALEELPLASDSIDAVLLPHTLERVEDPYAVLREAERVLCGEGCLMICGFNPWSGWGLRRLFARGFKRPPFPPGTRRLLSERRLRDWVALLGFDVDRVYGYLGSVPRAGGRAPPEGGRHPALGAGAYWLKARKRVPTLTALKPRRRARKPVLAPAAEPTTKIPHARR
ncbi:MAG: methyltransferase domain-containing protein [Gammaproteobacteria bacterium]|nr:methyltransferase domain-containing protein [Gammaproteobacteria bacterium]